VPVIADGGIKFSGDLAKPIAAEMAPYHLSVPLKDDPVSLASATAG